MKLKLLKTSPFKKWLSLSAFTLVFVIGELSHFLLGIVTRPMSQELHYGDKDCLANPQAYGLETYFEECHFANNSHSCDVLGRVEGSNVSACVWNYSGLGIDYQILAGPAFVAVFSISGILIGMVSDRFNRQIVVAVCFGVLTTATTLMGAASAYWQLIILRMLIGAGESSFSPACSSMISDIFEKDKQGLAMGIFNWGIYFGYGISYVIGNFVTAANFYDLGWRFSYYISGIMGFIVLLFLLIVVEEPARRKGDASTDYKMEERSEKSNERTNLSQKKEKNVLHDLFLGEAGIFSVLAAFFNPAVALLLIASCARHTAGFTWAYNTQLYFSTYYPSYNLGIWISLVSIAGGSIGVAIGGFVSDRLVKRLGLKARLYVLAGSQILASPFAIGVLYLAPPGAFFSLLGSYFFAEMWFGVLFAVFLEVFPSKMHSTAIAVFLFVMNNVGGNMPVLVEPLRNALSYRVALLIMYPGNYILSAILFFVTSFFVISEKPS